MEKNWECHDKIYDLLLKQSHLLDKDKIADIKNKEFHECYSTHIHSLYNDSEKYIKDNNLYDVERMQLKVNIDNEHIVMIITLDAYMIQHLGYNPRYINDIILALHKLNSRLHFSVLREHIISTIDDKYSELRSNISEQGSLIVYHLLLNDMIHYNWYGANIYKLPPTYKNTKIAIEIYYQKAFPYIMLSIFGKPKQKSLLNKVYKNQIYDRNVWRLIIRLVKPV